MREHGNAYNIFILVLTVLSLVVMVLLLLPLDEATHESLLFYDNIICVIFLVDFAYNIIRLEAEARQYFIDRRGWLDLLGSIPTPRGLPAHRAVPPRPAQPARRITRLLGGAEGKQLVDDVLKNRGQYALFITFLLAIIVLTISSVLDAPVREPLARTPTSQTGGDALWWGFVTITTVGYGDFYPVTILGRTTAVFVMFAGVGIIGALASILASILVPDAPTETAPETAERARAAPRHRATARSRPSLPRSGTSWRRCAISSPTDPDAAPPCRTSVAAILRLRLSRRSPPQARRHPSTSTGGDERMTEAATANEKVEAPGNSVLAILLAMAMFVLVVDTSIMNVSISAVVDDLDTDVSAIQAAIALEALVSAAFILIGSKIGDLFGRKRAYILGLLAYAVGALAMALGQSVLPIFIFWAVIGGLGASLLLPAMQSLIHGNFEGAAQKATYALVGAAAAIAAAVGPLIGGFITTFLSYRVAFLLEVVVIAIVLSGSRLVRDAPYTGPRQIDLVGAGLSVLGMGGLVLGILAWQEGGEAVGLLLAIGAISLAAFAYWLVRRKRQGKPTLIDPDLFSIQAVQVRDLRADAPEHLARWRDDHHPDLPADGPRIQRAGGGPVARPTLAQHVRNRDPGRQAGGAPAPGQHHPGGIPAPVDRDDRVDPDRAPRRRRLVPRGPAGDRRDRAGPPRLAAQQLHAGPDRRGAGQRGRRRELGGGLVRAVVRVGVRRRDHAGGACLQLHSPVGSEHRALPG